MCNCHSYNFQSGETPNVVLAVPDNILAFTDGRENVCVDACIADVVKKLWVEGFPTINSCCGHGAEPPSIIIPEENDPSNYLKFIRTVDNRKWRVGKWELVWKEIK